MVARTHNAFAFASLVTAAVYFPPVGINVMTLVTSFIAVSIGALIPDMDSSGNTLWKLLPSGAILSKNLRKIFYKHRTLTHSLLGVGLFYVGLAFLLPRILNPGFVDPLIIHASIMVGYASHLLADSLTEEGIPLLFPLRINFGIPPIRRMRIKTGRWFENLVIYPGIWIYLVIFVQNNREVLESILKNLG